MNFNKNNKLTLTLLFLVILLEGPIRLLLQPDPWLLHPTHWYFEQPSRLLIELSIVLVGLFAISKVFDGLLKVNKQDLPLIIGGSIGSVLLFGTLELDQLNESVNSPYHSILFWLGTGFLIGIGQELVYRGMLFTSLTFYFSKTIASFMTTFLFIVAPLHSVRLWELYKLEEYNTVLILIIVYAAASFFFQWLRDKSNNIVVPGIVHGIGNAITWLAVFS